MAGYNGWSMSNNAVAAYEDGDKPLSKWTKSDIFNAINEQVEIKCSIEKLKKLPVKVLKGICLRCSSWHHTSSYYNQTDFYSLDVKRVEELTDDKIKELLLSYKADKKAEVTEKIMAFLIGEYGEDSVAMIRTGNTSKTNEIFDILGN